MNEVNMRFIDPPQSDDRIVAAEINGQMTTDDMKALIDRLQTIVDQGEKALLLIDMQHYEGFEFGVVTEKFKHMGMLWKALDKYAIVGASRWMEIWIDIVNPLTHQQIKHFSPEETDDAWAWLQAK
jgi:hypothetical protein